MQKKENNAIPTKCMVCQGSGAAHKALWETLGLRLHCPGIPSPQALPTPSGARLEQHSKTGHTQRPNQSTFKRNLFIF